MDRDLDQCFEQAMRLVDQAGEVIYKKYYNF